MRNNQVAIKSNSFVNHSFGYVQTQQSPCCFRICQSNLHAGIIPSVLQRQRREPFKGAYYFLNFHFMENLKQR